MEQMPAMGGVEVEAFLSHLVSQRDVAAATQQQALAAILFLYRDVLGVQLPWLDNVVRPKKPRRLPTVLNRDEVMRVLALMDGRHGLMARLLYGSGMVSPVAGHSPPPFFRRGPAPLARLVVLVSASLTLLVVDHRLHYLELVRQGLSVMTTPLQVLAGMARAASSPCASRCA